MKVLVAPNAFKGTLTAEQAAQAIGAGVLHGYPDAEVVLLPAADGGDGTLDVLCQHAGFERIACTVTGPLGEPVHSAFGYLAGSHHACIETALACGLAAVPADLRTPLATTSYGVGELIAAALLHGAQTLTLGIGGTATVDGGLGAAQALGARFTANDGAPLIEPLCGADLTYLSGWDTAPLATLRARATWQVLCDVSNPLCGPTGAAATYGPQKGATPAVAMVLDQALARIYRGFAESTGRAVAELAGAGCGGGLGAFALQFLCDRLTPGSDAILDLLAFNHHLHGANYVVTGEGCLDLPSLQGKVPGAVLARARAANISAVAMVGSTHLADDEARGAGFGTVLVCAPNVQESAAQVLKRCAASWASALYRGNISA